MDDLNKEFMTLLSQVNRLSEHKVVMNATIPEGYHNHHQPVLAMTVSAWDKDNKLREFSYSIMMGEGQSMMHAQLDLLSHLLESVRVCQGLGVLR